MYKEQAAGISVREIHYIEFRLSYLMCIVSEDK